MPLEAEARCAGYRYIAGVDEAGRGPLAGPLVAAAVMLPAGSRIPGLRDSKQLSPRQRQALYGVILRQALTYGVGIVTAAAIDRHGIAWAVQAAMQAAVRQLAWPPDFLLIDGPVPLPLSVAQRPVVRGDACCASIAAASVVAKVVRDRLMAAYACHYPAYGFERHKGYATAEHYRRLRRFGACAIHRRSFRGVVAEGR
ncbi:MAG: ribonuclease HII [Candidatus Tectimicrobiota bacterium]|nr:MAG: ribonuclease HII [Candidatus Tectomicrobia bacterium]